MRQRDESMTVASSAPSEEKRSPAEKSGVLTGMISAPVLTAGASPDACSALLSALLFWVSADAETSFAFTSLDADVTASDAFASESSGLAMDKIPGVGLTNR